MSSKALVLDANILIRAVLGRRVQVVPQLASRAGSRLRIFLMYCFTSAESVNTATTSLRANHHSSLRQTRRMLDSWNTAMWLAGSVALVAFFMAALPYIHYGFSS
jgi:hypothetical protein